MVCKIIFKKSYIYNAFYYFLFIHQQHVLIIPQIKKIIEKSKVFKMKNQIFGFFWET